MSVGIIANPASGKDIRRLVAHATVFDNNEKANLIRRILLGLDSLGVRRVWFMPDYFGFYQRVLDSLAGRCRLALEARLLDMKINASQDDSRRAAEMMAAAGVSCIITLGGDGTNRVVAKGAGNIPLLPVSTGTNNVFPVMVEGTVAGLAAGLLATGAVEPEEALQRTKMLVIYINGRPADIALIDAVVLADRFTGSRAVWDASKIRQIAATRGSTACIGIASVVGGLRHIGPAEPCGMHVIVGSPTGDAAVSVRAAIGPGLIKRVPVVAYHLLQPGQRIQVLESPCVIALDGERELRINAGDSAEIELSMEGPWVVDIDRTLAAAAARGVFREHRERPAGNK
ncbi:ATP-NAD kinase family protein [Desulfofundulus thermosubterraneus]|uniref:Predicted polyphosphate-or ATP-dependent NAD kinase n=1 Tax=Desulfofundulus thermosubterraneus DSM 16057 TaxID=1121432 RepID=A0A1M6GKN9_9FIRM|nr:NAD(+)/NADH kinase [Desulfofundulus thermosubterraneus]SHJ10495.1 Predicted polyphosphate-or ATP-dependent NAD kinase [Desulfofundulus thermosubterraneus DSM 16057]